MLLLTIGYEGADPADFLDTLDTHEVSMLVDVRAVAGSRRRGFAKKALALSLNERGIGYWHLRDLGDPREGRLAARAGRWEDFRRIYDAQLRTAGAQSAFSALAAVVPEEQCILLCYEADAATCHRSIIAGRLAERRSLRVEHLRVSRGSGKYAAGARRHLDQGGPAPQP